MKKWLAVALCVIALFSLASCAAPQTTDGYKPISGLDTKTDATLKIAIPYETNKALNTVANAFMSKYPNVSIQLQYIEDYDNNAVKLFKENALDIILQRDVFYTEYTVKNEATGEKVPDGTNSEDFFYNFAADTEIDFSDTTPDLTDNYHHVRKDENGQEIVYQYCYPLGGETRGVYVNKTLLNAYGLEVPSNYTELLACCEALKQQGLTPIQGGADTAAYGLGLANATTKVVHNEAALASMKAAEPGVSKEFEDVLRKIYTLATRRYFDYKALEQQGLYSSTNELGQAESFLGLRTDQNTFEVRKPENNYGYAAFLPYLSSSQTVLQGLIEEYGLDTELTFICSPLNDEGTKSPAYITPYFGVCANKNSPQLVWIREFVNFLFQEENNKVYAENASIIPNTKDALQQVAEKYGLDIDKDITLCGQIRFSDTYNGYTPLANVLRDTLKCSAQKYMVNLNRDADGNIQYETDEAGKEFLYMGNGETVVYREFVGEEDTAMPGYAFCTLDYYLERLEQEFAKYRV